MRSLLYVPLALVAVGIPLAVTACSSQDSEEEATSETAELNARREGERCNLASKQCKTGLVCKQTPSGPPPGAVGLPLPPGSGSSSGPPPGAVGLPLPPGSGSSGPPPGAVGLPIFEGTCQVPRPREEGYHCFSNSGCNPGLVCEFPGGSSTSSSSSGEPPPGAVGLPLPPGSGSTGGPPPGTMGLPMLGTCRPGWDPQGGSSSGASGETCPRDGSINCMPITTNPDCGSQRRSWIEDNCPGVSFLD